MTHRILLFLLFLGLSTSTFASGGIFQTYILFNTDGAGDHFHAGGINADGATSYAGATYTPTTSLTLKGGEIKTYKNGGTDITGAEMWYRFYKAGTAAPVFTSVNFPFDSNLANPGDQKWREDNASIDLIAIACASGEGAGNYELEVYWQISHNNDGVSPDFDSNGGANFKSTFTLGATHFPEFNVSSVTTAAEGNGGGNTAFSFEVTKSNTCIGASVNWAVTGSGANAADAADFGGALPSGTLVFASGDASKTGSFNVTQDAVAEFAEGYTLTISSPTGGAAIGATASMAGAINNDDTPELNIAATAAVQNEGNAGNTALTFTVTRTGIGIASSANWAVMGSSGNPADAADFGGALPSGTVSFNTTETSKVIMVNASGDVNFEPNDTFTVTLSAPTGATINTATADGEITNDDACSISQVIGVNSTPCVNGGLDSDVTNDSFTVEISVIYANHPNSGKLILTGAISDSVMVSGLSSTTNHLFGPYTILADGSNLSVTATFSDGGTCTFTNAAAIVSPGPCPNSIIPTVSLVDSDGDGIPDITDPCSCADLLNVLDGAGNVTFFHDFIEITSAPGETWNITAYNVGGLYDNGGVLLPLGITTIPETSPGVYYLDVWHPDVVGFDADFTRTAGGGPFVLNESNACDNVTCLSAPAGVPTLSEWGIILFSLLLLNFGSLLIYQRNLVLAGAQKEISFAGFRSNIPFDKELFFKGVLGLLVVSFMMGISTLLIFGSISMVDIFGFAIAIPLSAFLIQLLGIKEK